MHIDDYDDNQISRLFCRDFIKGSSPKYILGTNEYASYVAACVDVDGFIDEFTTCKTFLNKPIINFDALPPDSMVVSVVVLAQPQKVLRKLHEIGIRYLDYFQFSKYSGFNVKQVFGHFHNDFVVDFKVHRVDYEWIYNLLSDDESRQVLSKIT